MGRRAVKGQHGAGRRAPTGLKSLTWVDITLKERNEILEGVSKLILLRVLSKRSLRVSESNVDGLNMCS